MAFKRSWVRLPSAPPPFALEPPELRVASHFFQQDLSGRNGLLERRVSPEASSSAKASEDIPRSFNEGKLAQGDYLFLIALEPPELRVASHFFTTTICCHRTLFRSKWMKYVYLLQSLSVPTQRYVGVTTNLEERLQAHNAGSSLYTSKYRPWKVVSYLCFEDDRRALDFEQYLKTGSGQAFANKRLW
jgi:putative endonuclease